MATQDERKLPVFRRNRYHEKQVISLLFAESPWEPSQYSDLTGNEGGGYLCRWPLLLVGAKARADWSEVVEVAR